MDKESIIIFNFLFLVYYSLYSLYRINQLESKIKTLTAIILNPELKKKIKEEETWK